MPTASLFNQRITLARNDDVLLVQPYNWEKHLLLVLDANLSPIIWSLLNICIALVPVRTLSIIVRLSRISFSAELCT